MRGAGDVILKILKDVVERRPRGAKIVRLRARCPVCGSDVVRPEGEAVARCFGGMVCSAQRKQPLLHFASWRAMNIEGLDEKIVDQLVDEGLVKSPQDLYDLTLDRLVSLERRCSRDFCTRSASETWASRLRSPWQPTSNHSTIRSTLMKSGFSACRISDRLSRRTSGRFSRKVIAAE